MRLIDADLMESNLRAKAMEMWPTFEIMAKTFEAAADMVAAMPEAVRQEEETRQAYQKGYMDGAIFAIEKWCNSSKSAE